MDSPQTDPLNRASQASPDPLNLRHGADEQEIVAVLDWYRELAETEFVGTYSSDGLLAAAMTYWQTKKVLEKMDQQMTLAANPPIMFKPGEYLP